jgi:hypothetical protein
MELIFTIIVVGIVIWWVRRPAKVRYGSISTALGTLSYKIGDEIVDDNGVKFRGIEVGIPKKLPHIYIDGHASDSLINGPRYVFDRNSKLSLEGDFNKHFQVYAFPEYKSLALSVLQPDIMAALIDNIKAFDIEIYHDSIRIITHKKVFNHSTREELLRQAASKIINELERRIRVWKAYDENRAGKTDLVADQDSTTKIGKRGVASFTLAIGFILGLIASGLAVVGWWLHLQDNSDYSEVSSYMYVAAFLLFPCLWGVSILAKRRRWI